MAAKNIFQLHGSKMHTQFTGDVVEISNLCCFN